MKRMGILLSVLLAVSSGFAYAGDAVHSITIPSVTTELKPGDGKDKTAGMCIVCHSLDYVTMQPKFSRAQWTATVNKMIKVMGAPITDEDAKTIIDYLAVQYGTGK